MGPVTAEILLIWTNVARTNVAWTNVHLTIVLDCPEWKGNSLLKRFKVWWKSGQWQLRYSWYGQMLPGQMLHGQSSIWQLSEIVKSEWVITSVKDVPRKQTLKFDQNRVSNSWDIADMDKCCQDKCCMDKYPYHVLDCQEWITSVKDVPRKQSLKFDQNRVSNR